jgi:hypothetical protein
MNNVLCKSRYNLLSKISQVDGYRYRDLELFGHIYSYSSQHNYHSSISGQNTGLSPLSGNLQIRIVKPGLHT